MRLPSPPLQIICIQSLIFVPVDKALPVYFSILLSSVKEEPQEKETSLSLNLLQNAHLINERSKLLYSPDLESLLTSTFIFSIMSDSARLVTPTQGSVSMVTLDQSFISEGHTVETVFWMTETKTFH